MKSHLQAGASALALTLVVLLAACSDNTGPQPGPVQLALVTRQLDDVLNLPARQLRDNLKRAAADHRIYAEEMVITGPPGTTPVDWWIYRKGFLRVAGVDTYYRGYFDLTPKGEAFVNGPAPQWLASTFQGQPQVVCAGEGGFTSCRVTASATIKLTADGAALFDSASIAPQSFTAALHNGPSGWSADELEVTGGTDTWLSVRTALFGDHDAIDKAHFGWAVRMNRRGR